CGVEEHTVLARRLLYRLIYAVVAVQLLLLLVDRLPAWLCLLNVASHLVYSSNLRRFPFVQLSDPLFLVSCALVGINHWLWFRYFSDPAALAKRRAATAAGAAGAGGGTTAVIGGFYDPYTVLEVPSFTQIASFFGLCVWLVPFALFVSLSASENVLPSMASGAPSPASSSIGSSGGGYGQIHGDGGEERSRRMKAKGMVKALVDGVRDWVGETSQAAGLTRRHRDY
ncbi:erv26 super protein, partial [Ascosphaera acerosa]